MSTQETNYTSSERLRNLKVWLWIAGLAAIALGGIGIVFPFLVTLAAELLFGGLLVVLGVVQIVRASLDASVEARIWTFLFGAVSLAVGAVLLLYPLGGIFTLTVLLATFFMVGGMTKLAGAWQMRRWQPDDISTFEGWGWLALSGAFSLALGVLLFVGLPSTAAWALGLLLSIDLVCLGIAEIAIAIGLSRFATL